MTTFFRSLRCRLVSLILFAVLPALGLIVYSAWQERSRAEEQVREEARQIAQIAELQQGQVIEGSREVLIMLASLTRNSDLQSINPQACQQSFAGLLADLPGYTNLGVAIPSGDIVCSAVPLSGPTSAVDRTWFQEALVRPGLVLGQYQVGKITGEEQLNIAYAIRSATGEVRGVAFLGLRLSVLSDTLARMRVQEGTAITIIDSAGTILARSPQPKEWTGKSVAGTELGLAIGSTHNGVASLLGVDGVRRLYAFDSIVDQGGNTLYITVGAPEKLAFAAINSQLRWSLFALGLVAFLALAAAWIGTDVLVLRRLQAILIATTRLQNGDLTARTAGRDDGTELGKLAASFDAMADSLQLHEDERDRAQTELQIAASELARKNEDLESFTYSVSHDLKEPLRGLEAFSQFLLEDYAAQLDEQGRDYLSKISKASIRMKHLIDDLLLLSRLSRQAVEPVRISVSQVVQDILEGLAVTISEKNAVVELKEDIPEVMADPARVEQIFANLIVNGLKFNDSETPTLTIGVEKVTAEMVTLFVKDNGIGIEPQYHERIFGVFQRLHARERYEGTGAGLAIVKRAAETSGGQVWVESQLGVGTTFFVSLPAWTEENDTYSMTA